MNNNIILKIIKKVHTDNELQDKFLYLLKDGVDVSENDITAITEILRRRRINADGRAVVQTAEILRDTIKLKQQGLQLQTQEEKVKLKGTFLNGMIDNLLEVLITDNIILKIIKKVHTDNELQDKFIDLLLIKKDTEEAKKMLLQRDIDASDEKISKAASILMTVKKIKQESLQLQTGEEKVKDAFLNGMVDDIEGIKKGYDKVLSMYIVAFYLGVSLLVAAIYSAIVLKEDLLTIVLGGIGGAEMLGSLIFRPAKEIQNSRRSLVQLKTAYLGWLNDMNNWNGYLYSRARKNKGIVPIQEVERSSKRMIENLVNIIDLIGRNGKGETDSAMDRNSKEKLNSNIDSDDKEK
jgi:hypothetical protein